MLCLQHRAELGMLGQPASVSFGLCAGRGMFRRAGLRREGSTGPLRGLVELYQPLPSSGEKPVSSKKQPQNAGFQVYSYGIIYHLGISATDLSAAALSCPGAHSCFPWGELPAPQLRCTRGWGSARGAWGYWAVSGDCLQVVACALMAAVTR